MGVAAVSNRLGVVIARGGSKGIPSKNLSLIGGVPLVSHIIQTAVQAGTETPMDLLVSTDSPEIRDVAIGAGAWAPFLRPAHLAGDDVPSYPVVQHAIEEAERITQKSYETVVYLQPTAPLCRSEDIVRCIDTLEAQSELESVVAVVQVDTHPFRMKRLLDDGRLINYIDQGFEDMRPRQSLPKVYRRAGSVYVSRRDVIINKDTLVGDPCKGIEVPAETAVDVDSPIDLELVRLLFNNKRRLTR